MELENRINFCGPGTIDVKIVDSMFFLHLFVDLSLTFSPLEKLIKIASKEVQKSILYLIKQLTHLLNILRGTRETITDMLLTK